MRSKSNTPCQAGSQLITGARLPLGLTAAAVAVLLFLHVPAVDHLAVRFHHRCRHFQLSAARSDHPVVLPSPGRAVTCGSAGAFPAGGRVATLVALVLGTLAAGAVYRSKFFGRDAISFLLVLPLALPGIVTGIALRSAISMI